MIRDWEGYTVSLDGYVSIEMTETMHIPLPRQLSQLLPHLQGQGRGNLWLSGPEDQEAFFVCGGGTQERLTSPVLSNVWQSILQLSSVHSSGQAVAAGKALGQLCPVAIVPCFWWWSLTLWPCLLGDLGNGYFPQWYTATRRSEKLPVFSWTMLMVKHFCFKTQELQLKTMIFFLGSKLKGSDSQ